MKAGVISERQLAYALEVHKATGSPLGRVLVDLGYVKQGSILSIMARQLGIPYIDFAEQKPDTAAIAMVPKDLATRYTLMPVSVDDQNRLVVAMADPQNVLALDDLGIITGYEIVPAISTKDDIVAAIGEYYKVAEEVAERHRRRG
jgi:type IV pilus assembly protein PilB